MTDRIDDEELLDRFRRWLQQARAEAERPAPSGEEVEAREVGLYQLVEGFTALRHELKLQTRSARGVQEQAEALQEALRQAIDQFRAVGPKEEQAAWAAGRPLAEALADLDEALDRGGAEVEKAARRPLDEPARVLAAALDDLYARQPWPRRLLVRPYHEQALRAVRAPGEPPARGLLDALREGYGLIQARLRRSLEAEQIRPIACVGRPVDPERMTVVGVVDDPDRPPGLVVEEVRRGYTWRGRLLRYAEVRASRAPASARNDDAGSEEFQI